MIDKIKMKIKIFCQNYNNLNDKNNSDNINSISLSSKKAKNIKLYNILEIYVPLLLSILFFFVILFILIRLINQNSNIFNKRKLSIFHINETMKNNSKFLEIYESYKNLKEDGKL